jgi:hypothetical protein
VKYRTVLFALVILGFSQVFLSVKIWRTEPSPFYNRFLASAAALLMAWTVVFVLACTADSP